MHVYHMPMRKSRRAYAEMPTASRIRAVATMPAALVKPKLYVHGWKGVTPAFWSTLCRVVTWVFSVFARAASVSTSFCVSPRAMKSAGGNICRPCW